MAFCVLRYWTYSLCSRNCVLIQPSFILSPFPLTFRNIVWPFDLLTLKFVIEKLCIPSCTAPLGLWPMFEKFLDLTRLYPLPSSLIPLNVWMIIWPFNLSLLMLMLEILIVFAKVLYEFVWEILFWFNLVPCPINCLKHCLVIWLITPLTTFSCHCYYAVLHHRNNGPYLRQISWFKLALPLPSPFIPLIACEIGHSILPFLVFEILNILLPRCTTILNLYFSFNIALSPTLCD